MHKGHKETNLAKYSAMKQLNGKVDLMMYNTLFFGMMNKANYTLI